MENCENATTAKSACTSIIAGRKQTDDGSMISARSEDFNAMLAKCFEIYEDTDNGPAEFVARDSAFRCQLPPGRLGYKALAPYHLPGHWGSAGFLCRMRQLYAQYHVSHCGGLYRFPRLHGK